MRALERRGWRRGLTAALLTLTVLGLLAFLAVRLSLWAIAAANRFAVEVPGLMQRIAGTLNTLEQRALLYISTAPEGAAQYMETAMHAIGDRFYDLPAILSQWALDFLAGAAQRSPDVLLFLVTAGIGTYFFSASFPSVLAFLKAQIPCHVFRHWEGMGQNLKLSFGGLFRAQLLLMGLTFFQLLLVFLLLQVRAAAAAAALTALIDALPVFGTGIVLVPWALWSLLLGQERRAAALLGSWLGINLIRSCVQAKLVGDQIGLNPLASLLAVYLGWQIWGVWGMLLFPVLFVALQQLNERGVIRLWKNV